MVRNESTKVSRKFVREVVDLYSSGAISNTAMNTFIRAAMAYELQVSLQEKLERHETSSNVYIGPKKREVLGNLLTR